MFYNENNYGKFKYLLEKNVFYQTNVFAAFGFILSLLVNLFDLLFGLPKFYLNCNENTVLNEKMREDRDNRRNYRDRD